MGMNATGAFVEIDQEKLTRDQLVLLGMKECMDKWVDEFDYQLSHAHENPLMAHCLREVRNRMASRRDDVAVVLTKDAIRHGAARLNNMKAEV